MKVLGVSRSPRFSPNSVERDAAIFELVGKQLCEQGHVVENVNEDTFNAALSEKLHECYDAVFSMARDEQVLRSLSRAEEQQLPVFNSAIALLGASRSVLTALFEQSGIPIPRSASAYGEPAVLEQLRFPLWLKRGDACAQTADDVHFLQSKEELQVALQKFSQRHIAEAVVCEHVEGDLVKFYGVADTEFFHHYYPTKGSHFSKFGLEKINGAPSYFTFDKEQLKACADHAARISGLLIYGGDCIVRADGTFVVIDFNDWPSFSVCAEQAAKAIAEMVLKKLKK